MTGLTHLPIRTPEATGESNPVQELSGYPDACVGGNEILTRPLRGLVHGIPWHAFPVVANGNGWAQSLRFVVSKVTTSFGCAQLTRMHPAHTYGDAAGSSAGFR